MAKKINLRPFIIQKLRSASLSWPARNEALKAARVGRGLYKCAICGEVYKKKMIHLDHKEPVVDPAIGWVDFNTFISRLFCDVDGFQCLCSTCHSLKTEQEDQLRKFHKRYVKIQGYEKLYDINKKGVVRSIKTKTPKKLEIHQEKDGRRYCIFHDKTKHYIDELIMKHFTDEWKEGCKVIHKDFNPSNDLFSNLEVVCEEEE